VLLQRGAFAFSFRLPLRHTRKIHSIPTHAVKNFIRNRDFFKIISAVETGAEHGMWSFQRYRSWLDSRTTWFLPDQNPEPVEAEAADSTPSTPVLSAPKPSSTAPIAHPHAPSTRPGKTGERIEIEPVETEFGKILKRPGPKPNS